MSLEERKKEFSERISVYALRREVKTLLVKSMMNSFEEGYRLCATEIRDIVWPTEGNSEKINKCLSDLVDLIDDLVIDKDMKPLEKSQYDTLVVSEEPKKELEPERCDSCRGTVFMKNSKGKKYCIGCGRDR